MQKIWEINVLNDREDKLFFENDKKFNDLYFEEEIIKEVEKFPKKKRIIRLLAFTKTLNDNWDNKNLKLSIYN